MDFTPFNIACYDKLYERFQYLFEPELINEVCQHGKLKSFESDEIIIDIGQIVTAIPLIVSGSIKILMEDENQNELLLYYLELGETCAVSLNSCSKKTKSTVRAIAEVPTELLFITVAKMEDWMIRYSSWRSFVLDSYNNRLAEMLRAIDNLAFHNMEERIYQYLRSKAMINHQATVSITHHQIANDLNSSRVVVSRLMKKLEIDRKVIQHRNKIEILEFQ